MSTIVFLRNVRLSHPHLWVPSQPMAGSTSGPKYDGTFIMAKDSEAFKEASAAFIKEAQTTFGANYANIVGAMSKDKKCLRDGNTKLTKEGTIARGYENMMYVSAKNKAKPVVIASRFFNGKPVHMDEAGNAFVDGRALSPAELGFTPKNVYGGCYVNAKIEIYAMNKPGMQGIYATLQAVQFHDDGEALGGGAAPSADGFSEGEYDDGEASGNPFAGAPEQTSANLFG